MAVEGGADDGTQDGNRSKTTAALRGLMGQCPACGRGRLLRNYLKPVDQCAHCGEAFGHLFEQEGVFGEGGDGAVAAAADERAVEDGHAVGRGHVRNIAQRPGATTIGEAARLW